MDNEIVSIACSDDLEKIIEIREPIGLFYYFDNKTDTYIGIDNSTGEAWTEDFPDEDSCEKWLLNPSLLASSLIYNEINEKRS
ncbi:MAG: hypothetical protein FWE05_11865 [Defluviitaleaceae bacterium]|nr:hypothetical protein [Defluviitaleaceae bacterium]